MSDPLWAPWRLAYILRQTPADDAEPADADWVPGADRGCFLCRGLADRAADAHRRRLILERRPSCVVVLNRFPYINGHLLIAPLRHVARLDELGGEVEGELYQTITRWVGRIEQMMKPEGFNVGLNLGRVAGAGVPGHLHWHIVPRWNGDTNFMPTIANTSVIPQSLDALWEAAHVE